MEPVPSVVADLRRSVLWLAFALLCNCLTVGLILWTLWQCRDALRVAADG